MYIYVSHASRYRKERENIDDVISQKEKDITSRERMNTWKMVMWYHRRKEISHPEKDNVNRKRIEDRGARNRYSLKTGYN